MDYIHGEIKRTWQRKNAVGFFIACNGEKLFPYVTESGTLQKDIFHGTCDGEKDIIWKQDRFADMTRKDKIIIMIYGGKG